MKRYQMKEMICQCGGSLIPESGNRWRCPNCHTYYIADSDASGYEFLYQPIEKKTIESGQMAQKASSIAVQTIAVRDIKLKEDIQLEISKDSLLLSKEQAIRAVRRFIQDEQYEKASQEINQYLLQDKDCAEILWYSILCEKKFVLKVKENGRKVFDGKLTPFSEENKYVLDSALLNSPPTFARTVLRCCYGTDYSDDESCFRILSTGIPYSYNESVFSEEERIKIFGLLFDSVIQKGFPRSFDYLLNTLESSQVDLYINYNLKFANSCDPQIAKKYLRNVLNIDAGNIDALKKQVQVDLLCQNVSIDESIADLENLLRYSLSADDAVLQIINFLMLRNELTKYQSDFMRRLIGYHSLAPQGIEKELLSFANKLLKSNLFAEAKEYFYLVLSFDKDCGEAFFGLCLARLEAKDRNDVVGKDELLLDCQEYAKCIALSDEKTQDTYQKISKEQQTRVRNKKNRKKKIITVCSALLAIFLAIVITVTSCNAIKTARYKKTYSIDNVTMSVTGKSAGGNSINIGGYVVLLDFELSNSSTVDIYSIEGTMNIYLGESDLLMTWDVRFVNYGRDNLLPAGTTQHVKLTCDSRADEMWQFYNSSLDDLKITFIISEVVYHEENSSFGYETIENDNENETVIKPYRSKK